MKTTIIIPIKHEPHVLTRVFEIVREYPQLKIILANDVVTKKIKISHKNIQTLNRTINPGIWPSIQEGIQKSTTAYIAWLDVDMLTKENIQLIMQYSARLKNTDVFIGSRYIRGGLDQRGIYRYLASLTINTLARLFINYKYTDYTSGFIIAKKNIFKDFKPNRKYVFGEYFIELFAYLLSMNYLVKEIPCCYYPDYTRKSALGKNTLKHLYVFVNYLFAIYIAWQSTFQKRFLLFKE